MIVGLSIDAQERITAYFKSAVAERRANWDAEWTRLADIGAALDRESA